jgi:hypothetical protein
VVTTQRLLDFAHETVNNSQFDNFVALIDQEYFDMWRLSDDMDDRERIYDQRCAATFMLSKLKMLSNKSERSKK